MWLLGDLGYFDKEGGIYLTMSGACDYLSGNQLMDADFLAILFTIQSLYLNCSDE